MKFALLVTLATVAAAGQSNWDSLKSLPAGEEIRVSLEGGKSYRGQAQSVTDESLIVIAATVQQTLPRAQIVKVAVKREGNRGRNTLIGLGIGAGTGVAVGAGLDHSCAAHGCFISNNLGKVIFTPVGAIIGTAIGALWHTGGWHEVYRK